MRSTGANIVFPSGLRAHVARRDKPVSAALRAEGSLVDETLRAIGDGRLEVRVQGKALDLGAVLALDVCDFHVLRDAALRLGLVATETEDIDCDNCDAKLSFDPRRLALDDLSERYADDAPVSRERTYALSESLPIPRGGAATRVRFRSVSVREALPFFSALDRETFSVTPAYLAGMGLVALEDDDGNKRIDKPVFLSRALTRASDAVWVEVQAAYLEHVYPAAAVAPLVCAACGVLREMEVPWPREYDLAAAATPRALAGSFLTPEAFEDRVEVIGKRVFDAMRVQNIALRVEPGPADTDLGGEPLLGSYEPRREVDDAGYTTMEFLVTVYYRTFERRWTLEGEYDVDAEIRETIEHEVEHHIHHLAGHDPMDVQERAEAEREVARVAGGRARVRRMALGALFVDLGRFVRGVGPWLLLCVLAFVILVWLRDWL